MRTLVDAMVLSNFAAVDRLDLLRATTDEPTVALAVRDEIAEGVRGGRTFLQHALDAMLPQETGWLRIAVVDEADELRLLAELPARLHAGEAQSIAIAVHRNWAFLTDDRDARTECRRRVVAFSGTLGVLVRAVHNGVLGVEEGNALLGGMIARANYRSPVTDLRELL